MNLSKLFEIQRKLDEHIEKEHPRQSDEDRLAKKILALQVELGELAQNWRGFKFWSGRQEPVTNDLRVADYKESGEAILETYNPLLEEYVDCLRFILSIGNDLGLADEIEDSFTNMGDMPLIGGFKAIYRQINDLSSEIDYGNSHDVADNYEFLINDFIGLGEKLGFTRKQIEQAYLDKNKVNYERQEQGY